MLTQATKKRVLSGVQATGNLTLGNYMGSLSQWAKHQGDDETIFMVADLHTLTIPENMSPAQRRTKTREIFAIYMACGIDPKLSTIFIQSHIKQHTELAWLLDCVTPIGWLERMTQFKSKSHDLSSVGSGLLLYPVLQTADILLYDTDKVPVGDDQRQHIELACDIAERFNHLFGKTFCIPAAVIPKTGARIMGLDDPTAKMSKSTAQVKAGHAVCLLDDEKVIKKTIMSAQTDSGQEFRFAHATPGVMNLMTIYEVLTQTSRSDIEERFLGKGYGDLKKDVLDIVLETLKPIQGRYAQIMSDVAYVDQIALEGANRIRPIAERTMQRALDATGMG